MSEETSTSNTPKSNTPFGILYKNIFFKPSLTFIDILGNTRKEYNIHFFILTGIYSFLTIALSTNYNEYLPKNLPFSTIIILSVFVGGVIGYLTGWVSGWVLYFIGKKMGSTAKQVHFQTVYAWSQAPVFFNFILLFVQLLVFGAPIGNLSTDLASANTALISIINFAGLFLSVIQMLIVLRGLQILHKGKIMNAFGNFFIPGAVIMLIYILVLL